MNSITFEEFRTDLHKILDEMTFETLKIMLPDGRCLYLSLEECYVSACREPRRALKMSELSEEQIQALMDAKVPEGLEHLNALLDEEPE
ncbi:MAG TPA: hypothetical protein VL625_09785 [Patescibacteria group bacterium]|nr:hypothetical protein [Patescibacteria group bacterium]